MIVAVILTEAQLNSEQFSVREKFRSLGCLIALILAVVICYKTYYQTHRSGVTASVANRMMWDEYKLPESASDVTYYVDFGGCEAEFSISSVDLVQLCQERNWRFVEIDSPIEYFDPERLPANKRLVVRGYTIDVPDGEGVFDADRSRAAFWVSTFP